MSDLVLVSRLKELYWPTWCKRLTLKRVRRARPQEYRPDTQRGRRGYDSGRVLALMHDLKRGLVFDPVEIETLWCGYTPTGLVLLDGHHRFVAAVLSKARAIPASVGGLVSMRDWLVGDSGECPF